MRWNFIFISEKKIKSKNRFQKLVEFLEANFVGVLSEESPTDVHVVLSDDTVVGARHSAAARAFAVPSWVGVPDVLVGHFLI